MFDKRKIQDRISRELLRIREQIKKLKESEAQPAKIENLQPGSRPVDQSVSGAAAKAEAADHLREQMKERIAELEKTNGELRQEIAGGRQAEEELKRCTAHLEEQMKRRISDLENSNAKLQQEIMMYRQTIERFLELALTIKFSEEAVVEMTLEGSILRWNSGAEKLFGYSADEVKGFSFFILVPRERYEEFSRIIKQIGQGEEVPSCETVFVRKDGQQIRVSVAATAIKNEAGQITGVSLVSSDPTARERIISEILQTRSNPEASPDSHGAGNAGETEEKLVAILNLKEKPPKRKAKK